MKASLRSDVASLETKVEEMKTSRRSNMANLESKVEVIIDRQDKMNQSFEMVTGQLTLANANIAALEPV